MLNSAEKIYGPSPRARNIMVGIWLLCAVPLTLLGLIEHDSAMLVAVVILSAIMLPIFWFSLRTAKLILTADGIELRQVGANVSAPWSNVAAIRTQRGAEGLVLHQPMSGKGAERLAAVSGVSVGGAPMYDDERRQLLDEQRFIPLDGFAYWLHKGDLHETILQRATALNAELTHALKTPPPSEKMPRKTLALIIVIIAAALGLGIASAMVPAVKSAVEPIIGVVLMLAFSVYALKHLYDAVNHLRARHFGRCALSLLIALIQVMLAIAALGWNG
ncbi:MAG: hypothetical protein ABL891_23530 [Burkholderiales bacterium]